MNILQEIERRTKERIEAKKKAIPLDRLVEIASSFNNSGGFPFEKALRSDDISFICEVKKASPSKGPCQKKSG